LIDGGYRVPKLAESLLSRVIIFLFELSQRAVKISTASLPTLALDIMSYWWREGPSSPDFRYTSSGDNTINSLIEIDRAGCLPVADSGIRVFGLEEFGIALYRSCQQIDRVPCETLEQC